MILQNKKEMIDFIMDKRAEEYKTIDTAIPMHLWKDCDTQLSAYAYYKNGMERVISLPDVIAYIQGGVHV